MSFAIRAKQIGLSLYCSFDRECSNSFYIISSDWGWLNLSPIFMWSPGVHNKVFFHDRSTFEPDILCILKRNSVLG